MRYLKIIIEIIVMFFSASRRESEIERIEKRMSEIKREQAIVLSDGNVARYDELNDERVQLIKKLARLNKRQRKNIRIE